MMNTILTKWQDVVVVSSNPDGTPRHFKHPALQSALMFCGELACLLIFTLSTRTRRSAASVYGTPAGLGTLSTSSSFLDNAAAPLLTAHSTDTEQQRPQVDPRLVADAATESGRAGIAKYGFALPAACDMLATTLLNVGLFFTYASVFQMLRGTLVVFAGMYTVVFLKRRLSMHHWLASVLICTGCVVVGLASASAANAAPPPDPIPPGPDPSPPAPGPDPAPSDSATNPMLGNTLIVLAQAVQGFQIIVEERLLAESGLSPVKAVGLEGAWGLAMCAVVMSAVKVLSLFTGVQFDDVVEGMRQLASNGQLAIAAILSVACIATFNVCGILITKHVSGAARSTVDASRTIAVWGVSLALGWERFLPMQVVGFVMLLVGTLWFNGVIVIVLGPSWSPKEGPARRHTPCAPQDVVLSPDDLAAAAAGSLTRSASGEVVLMPRPRSRTRMGGQAGLAETAWGIIAVDMDHAREHNDGPPIPAAARRRGRPG
ncbi:unnamed protein product [Pedinophyceae sp. YPF-701]|nr:unnamed protein product [Pedinophyceae sp. YPF-701]